MSTAAMAANPIQTENLKPGSPNWVLSNPGVNREIEGYASLTSVSRGGAINLYVSTSAATYTVDVYRLGWYGGAGARQVLGPITRTGFVQPTPTPDADGLIECAWTNPFTISVPNNASDPTDWASGVYLAKLTAGTNGPQSYIIFTVRDDARPATYLFQSSVNTWQAYNNWGGKSTYAYQSSNAPAVKVSFNRPYARNSGTGDFLGSYSTEPNVYGWEINMLRFMEREGYDVTYVTNVDLHERGAPLFSARQAFLSVGHDEYWSYQMKVAAHQARDEGRNLGFFGANAVYWQIRYEPSKVTPSAANRTMVAYKEAAEGSDPYWATRPSANNKYTTTRFRDLPVPPYNIVDPIAQPENGLVGVMFHSCCYPTPPGNDMLVSDALSWIYSGTGVSNGTHLPGLLGYEVDAAFTNGYGPSGLQIAATSPVNDGSSDGFSHMALYSAANGALVFATGSIQWAWGVDNFNVPVRPAVQSAEAQTITRNVLTRLAVAPLPAPTNLAAAQTGTNIKLTWTQGTGAVSNNIYRATSAAGPFSLIRTLAATTSYVDSTVAKRATYFYVVTAVNGSSESTYSNQTSATSK